MPFAQVKKVEANGTYDFRRDSDSSTSPGITLGATVVGPTAVAAVVTWYHSNDGIGYDLLATQTLSGTSLDKTTGNAVTYAPHLQAVVTGFAGTYLNLSIGE